jgi:OmpA-OmpF porin, OOP family
MATTPSVFSSLLSTLDSRRIGDVASSLGESPQAISTGFESLTASMLGGMANRAGDSTWMNQLHNLVSQAPTNVNVGELANAATGTGRTSAGAATLIDSGKTFVSHIFGPNQSSVIDAIGRFTGLRSGVLTSLASMAAPLLMSTLGRLVRDNHMTPNGLKDLVTHEAEGVRGMLPPGFSDIVRGTPVPAAVIDSRPYAIGTIAQPRTHNWAWLLLLLLIPLLFWWAYAARHHRVLATNLGPFVNRMLPNNIPLRIPVYGVESQLLGYIQDPTKGIDPNLWFNFDRLEFATDSATLRPASQEQLRNIAEIMKAYPAVKMNIGGFTDNTGDTQHNIQLSQDRANAVVAQLVNFGIAPDRLQAQGYGEQFPIGDNATEAGRAMNRRVSMNVTQK